ncbi:MAG: phage portal protein [Hyphomonadaceae bacterium]
MWLDRLLNSVGLERRDHSLSAWSPELAALFGAQPSAAGVSVTAETAMRSPTFLACTRLIAETLGSLPIHVFEKGPNGERTRASDHPVSQLLSGDWAPWESGCDTRTALQVDVILHGQAFARVLKANGKPREIHRLEPSAVAVDRSGPEPVFRTKINGEEERLDWREVVFVSTPGSAPGRPMSLVNLLREAIGLDLVMAEHQGRIFANGARPAGLLKAGPNKIGAEQLEFLRKQFSDHAGAKSGKTLILEDGFDFKELQFNSVDLQFLELRRLAGQDIARGMKVPGTLVGDLERATWRNVEELNRQFVTVTLLPWIERWTGALARVLLTPVERQTLYLEFIPEDLLRGDITARFTAYRQAAGGAFLTPNEIRELENRSPIDGGDKLILQAGQSGSADQPSAAPAKPRAVA